MASSETNGESSDRLEFPRIFEDNVSFVWRVLEHHGIRGNDLEDATQEVFIVVARKLSELDEPARLRSWLFGIARRVAAAQRRKAHVRRERPMSDTDEYGVDDRMHERSEHAQALGRLQSVLDGLKEEQRIAFLLREVEQFSIQEVADAMGCPLQTAYSRVRAARETVIAVFQAQEQQKVVDAG